MYSINRVWYWLIILLVMLIGQAIAAEPREHHFIRPIPGFSLTGSEFKNFSAFEFKIKQADGSVVKKSVKGKYWELMYEYKKGDREFSRLEIVENYRRAAQEKGGKVLSGDDVVLDFTVPLPGGGNAWAHLHTSSNYYELTVVDEEGFKKRLTFSAEEMKNKLDSEGRVAIYGIHFDFDKADLKVGSEKVLTEMVKLMKDNPKLMIEIQGHSDIVGDRAYNKKLSGRRASTVRDYLRLYGIDPARMTVQGFGPDRPVAGNDTEEGRALNRRVELKKL